MQQHISGVLLVNLGIHARHGVIAISDSLLVIGGARASKTERCWRDDENDTVMKCVELKTAPDGKMIRPTLVLVPSDYCITAP